MIEFHCSGCGYSKSVDDKLLGRKVICPRCKKTSRVRPVESLTVEVAGPPKLAASKPPKFKTGLVLGVIVFAGLSGWWISSYLADSSNEMPKNEVAEHTVEVQKHVKESQFKRSEVIGTWWQRTNDGGRRFLTTMWRLDPTGQYTKLYFQDLIGTVGIEGNTAEPYYSSSGNWEFKGDVIFVPTTYRGEPRLTEYTVHATSPELSLTCPGNNDKTVITSTTWSRVQPDMSDH